MKKEPLYYLLLLTCLLATGCESVLEIALPEESPKLVLNAILIPDSTLVCQVSKSQNVLDNAPLENIGNAVITVQRNGQAFETIQTVTQGAFGSSFYKGIHAVLPTGQYTFTVTAPGSDSISAGATIPDEVPIISIDTTTILLDGESRKQVAVHFKDPPGTHYYQILLYELNYIYVYDSLWNLVDSFPGNPQTAGFNTTDMMFNAKDDFWDKGAVFSDEAFDGRNYVFNLLPQGKNFVEIGPKSFYRTFLVQLNCISRDYYRYLKSSILYQESNGNPFAQPVQVYGNIDGGYGIVGAQHSSNRFIEL